MIKDYEKILAPYWQKGGTYVMPTGIVNDLLGELEDLESENKHLLELQEVMDLDFDELIKERDLYKNIIAEIVRYIEEDFIIHSSEKEELLCAIERINRKNKRKNKRK